MQGRDNFTGVMSPAEAQAQAERSSSSTTAETLISVVSFCRFELFRVPQTFTGRHNANHHHDDER